MSADNGLKYVGKEDQFGNVPVIAGIPTTDLTAEEVKTIAKKRGRPPGQFRDELIDSKLYAGKRVGKAPKDDEPEVEEPVAPAEAEEGEA